MGYYHKDALPIGSSLNEFTIKDILGQGGFGITYRAYDTMLERTVAIKEYLPAQQVVRDDKAMITLRSLGDKEVYDWGLTRFLDEAKTLARFKHPNIVRVLRYMKANGTAYLVMDYEEGQSLFDYLSQQGPRLNQGTIERVFFPILMGLQAVHEAHFLHRDIKPENIYLRTNFSPLLIDFGAARQAWGLRTCGVTALATPGYAPIEQYSADGAQGPWTDLYAIGASMYHCVYGKRPADVIARQLALNEGKPDPLSHRLEKIKGEYSQTLLECIRWALLFHPKERPQTVAEYLERLFPSEPRFSWLASTTEQEAGLFFEEKLVTYQDRIDSARKSMMGGNRMRPLSEAMEMQPKPRANENEMVSVDTEEEEPVAVRLDSVRPEPKVQPAKKTRSDHLAARRSIRSFVPGTVFFDKMKDGSQGPELIVIPSGEYEMGDLQNDGYANELPVHTVTIAKDFAMMTTVVTNLQYVLFNPDHGSQGYDIETSSGEQQPVVCVSWEDAHAYAEWLSQQTGARYRLPTEAEWEYAARSGSRSVYHWGDDIGTNQANCKGCSSQWDGRSTAPVKSFAPNAFGLYEMHGNIWEWVEDCWHNDYKRAPSDGSAWLQGDATRRVIRGGYWNNSPRYIRAACRLKSWSQNRYFNIGFRLIREL